jgi:hypothetical protein
MIFRKKNIRRFEVRICCVFFVSIDVFDIKINYCLFSLPGTFSRQRVHIIKKIENFVSLGGF